MEFLSGGDKSIKWVVQEQSQNSLTSSMASNTSCKKKKNKEKTFESRVSKERPTSRRFSSIHWSQAQRFLEPEMGV